MGTVSIIFDSGSGAWTVPAGVTTVAIEIWGGGGGGDGGGGGGGGYCKRNAKSVTPGDTIFFAVGDGGDPLIDGNDTLCDSMGAQGGGGASGDEGGSGGSASGGDVNISGGDGGDYAGAIGGDGGDSPNGGAGGAGVGAGVGEDGSAPGGGGGGSDSVGGAGASGRVKFSFTSDSPVVTAVGALAAGTGSITVMLPTGWQQGDLLLLFVETANQSVTISSPAGWTQISASPQGTGTAGGTTATRLTAYYKIASGSESNVSLADSGDHTIAYIVAIANFNTSNPIDTSAGDVAATASTSVTFPAVTTSADKCLIINAVAVATDIGTARISSFSNGALTNVAKTADFASTSGNGGGIALIQGVLAAAGGSGNTTATLNTSSVQGRITIALAAPVETEFDETIAESTAASEAFAASLSISVARTESAAAADGITGGKFYTSSRTESAGASEVTSSQKVIEAEFIESAAIDGSFTVQIDYYPALTEVISAGDEPASLVSVEKAISETVTATDGLSYTYETLGYNADSIFPILFAELDFPDGFVRVHNSLGTLTWDDKQWLGVGTFGSASAVEDTAELTRRTMAYTLSGIPNDLIAAALGQQYQGRSARLYLGFFDSQIGQLVATPVLLDRGRMDYSDTLEGKDAVVTIYAENRFAAWDRPLVRRFTDADQQSRFPGDLGLQFVDQAADKEINWGRKTS